MRAAPSGISFSSCVHGCDAFRFRLGVCAFHQFFENFAKSYGSLFVPPDLLLSFPVMSSGIVPAVHSWIASGVSWFLCHISPSVLCILGSREPLQLLGPGFAAWLMLLRYLFRAAALGAASSVCEVASVDCCAAGVT